MAMRNPIHRVSLKAPTALAVCIGLSWLLSCSSTDEAPGGGRIEYPTEAHPSLSAPLASNPRAKVVAPSPPVMASALPSEDASSRQRTPSEVYEQTTGIKLSAADKAIMDDCPPHALSKDVPKRTCTKDEQCGDGFCDRGRCGTIWTCTVDYGQRCEEEQKCGTHYLCMNGRCSSCVSDSECKSYPNNQDPKCVPYPTMPGVVACYGVVPRAMGSSEPWKPPPPPK